MRPSWLRKTEQGCQVTVICCMTKRSLAFQNKKKDHCTRWCNKLYTSSRSCKHFDFNNALKKYPIYQWAWEFIGSATVNKYIFRSRLYQSASVQIKFFPDKDFTQCSWGTYQSDISIREHSCPNSKDGYKRNIVSLKR